MSDLFIVTWQSQDSNSGFLSIYYSVFPVVNFCSCIFILLEVEKGESSEIIENVPLIRIYVF